VTGVVVFVGIRTMRSTVCGSIGGLPDLRVWQAHRARSAVPRSLVDPSAAADYQERLLAEFVLARLAHGVADGTIRGGLAAVEEFLASARGVGLGG
jgi:hypothetical protein